MVTLVVVVTVVIVVIVVIVVVATGVGHDPHTTGHNFWLGILPHSFRGMLPHLSSSTYRVVVQYLCHHTAASIRQSGWVHNTANHTTAHHNRHHVFGWGGCVCVCGNCHVWKEHTQGRGVAYPLEDTLTSS